MENFESPKSTEKPTDLEFALYLIKHIQAPCGDTKGNNLRDFYLREAKRALETMKDTEAKEFLKSIIKEYSE
jgi:hypothetical protein